MVSRDTSSEEQVEQSQMLYDQRRIARREAMLKVLGTYEGRMVLFDVIARGDIYDLQGAFPYEPAQTQRALGRREVALEVLKDALTVDPGVYILMQKEAEEFESRFAPTDQPEEDD